MAQAKQEFEKQLGFFARAGQWYVLPVLLLLTVVVGYITWGMGSQFNVEQITLAVVFVILIIVDGLVIWNLKRK
ncbi:MAG: hypothetical protein ACRCWD_06310 [Culicoidibacterales bacterium]